MSSGNIAGSSLSSGSASVAAAGLDASVVVVVELGDLAVGRAFGSARAEVVVEGMDRVPAVAGSNSSQAEAGRRKACAVPVACCMEIDTVPEPAAAAAGKPVAAAGACIHPFVALGQCSSFPSHLPRPLALALMQCLDTSHLVACRVANIGLKRSKH